jgi:hypothetical protein
MYFKKVWWIYRMPEILIVVIISTCMFSTRVPNLPTNLFQVLSDELGWDKLGVDILGEVPIKTGSSLIRAPFRADTMQYVRRTTSTAVYDHLLPPLGLSSHVPD